MTLMDMRKEQKKLYGPNSSGLIPKLYEFGMLLIKDRDDEASLHGYCIIRHYTTNLFEYLNV